MWCVHVSGPSVIQASSAAVSTDAFGGTSSLRQRLARSLITTTANSSSAGNLKDSIYRHSGNQRLFCLVLNLLLDWLKAKLDWKVAVSARFVLIFTCGVWALQEAEGVAQRTPMLNTWSKKTFNFNLLNSE